MSVFQHFQHQFAGNVAIVDYESEYQKADKVKYLNYLTGIANRYQREKKDCPVLRMVVIYTGHVERRQVSESYDIGAVKMHIETAFLSELDKDGISRRLAKKIGDRMQQAFVLSGWRLQIKWLMKRQRIRYWR